MEYGLKMFKKKIHIKQPVCKLKIVFRQYYIDDFRKSN